jgi:RNA-directed DNA polymerase
MRIDSKTLASLGLQNFAQANLKYWRDRFPPMIIERCIQDSGSVLVRYLSASYGSGTRVPSETLTMPRAGFGPRPVTVTDLPSRLLYSAMVDSIKEYLPAPTRGPGKWDAFQDFGLEGSHEYIVELDIASFYEFIDHDVLFNELLLLCMNLDLCRVLKDYLGELLGRARGIPQMLPASDRLADAYLSILDRKLSQDGYVVARFVDDIRIIAETWDDANVAIERAADYARQLGLILSAQKTGIFKRTTLADQRRADMQFFNKYFTRTRTAMTQIMLIGSYDSGVQKVEIKPEEQQAARAAAWTIMSEWWNEAKARDPQGEVSTPTQRFINQGLYVLREHPEQLDPQLLQDIVFRYPRKIEQVASYLIARAKASPNVRDLRPLHFLIAMGRQSGWSKLWLLHTIEQIAPPSFTGQGRLGIWMREQLDDRHEIVRAQAAWLCATRRILQSEKLTELYRNASSISQPALAAAATFQGDIPNNIVSAVANDSILNREASKWAALQAS